ncbi:E3 ubiquitin ligase, partial [Nowakowskiella sp. JEL0078]
MGNKRTRRRNANVADPANAMPVPPPSAIEGPPEKPEVLPIDIPNIGQPQLPDVSEAEEAYEPIASSSRSTSVTHLNEDPLPPSEKASGKRSSSSLQLLSISSDKFVPASVPISSITPANSVNVLRIVHQCKRVLDDLDLKPDDKQTYDELESNPLTKPLICTICIELISAPHMLLCGHSYCFKCILPWLRTSRSCPSCRAHVTAPPALNRALAECVEAHIKHTPQASPYARRIKIEETEAQQHGEAVWDGLFDDPRELIQDGDDGVWRCPVCAWEVYDGMCAGCGAEFGSGSELGFPQFSDDERLDDSDEGLDRSDIDEDDDSEMDMFIENDEGDRNEVSGAGVGYRPQRLYMPHRNLPPVIVDSDEDDATSPRFASESDDDVEVYRQRLQHMVYDSDSNEGYTSRPYCRYIRPESESGMSVNSGGRGRIPVDSVGSGSTRSNSGSGDGDSDGASSLGLSSDGPDDVNSILSDEDEDPVSPVVNRLPVGRFVSMNTIGRGAGRASDSAWTVGRQQATRRRTGW